MRFMTPDTAIVCALDDFDITIPGTGDNPLEVTFGTDPHTWVDYIPAATIGSREPDGDLSRITAPIPVDAALPGDITFPDPDRDDVTPLILDAGVHLTPFMAARILSAWSDNHPDGYDTWIMAAKYPPYTGTDIENITDTKTRSVLSDLCEQWASFGEKCQWGFATDFELGWAYGALSEAAIRADAAMLRQVWSNLIENAAKYSTPSAHPRIEIGSVPQGINATEHVFYVRDNGVGFDMKYAA